MWWKMSISLRNFLAIFVTTDLLNGGLNRMIFLFCYLSWVLLVFMVIKRFIKASWYKETDSLNTFPFEDILESLVSIEISSRLVIQGGWFNSL